MCEKCSEIELTIDRFRSIKCSVSDQLTVERAQEVIADLEAQKATLHIEGAETAAIGKYYLDTRDGEGFAIDHEGTSLRNIKAAREEATQALLDIARDNALARRQVNPMTIQ